MKERSRKKKKQYWRIGKDGEEIQEVFHRPSSEFLNPLPKFGKCILSRFYQLGNRSALLL